MGVVLAVLCAGPGAARATVYPFVPLQDDVRLVADPYVDLALRLKLIRNARHTIDLSLYEQGDDDVGLPILAALRDAADRGVRVRVLTQWFFQYAYHPFNQSPSYATNPPTRVPLQYLVFGAPEDLMRHGLHASDGVHGKVLVVDDAVALSTGRGHAKMNMTWIDSSNLVRGPLVQQLTHAFGRTWDAAARFGQLEQPLVVRSKRTPDQVKPPPSPADPGVNAPWVPDADELWTWATSPRVDAPSGRARLLHTDFVAQMAALKAQRKEPRGWEERMAALTDPALDAVVARLDAAGPTSKVRMTSMYALLHPRLKDALCQASVRGANVVFYTNGDFESAPISTFAWFASVLDLEWLVRRCGVELFSFVRNPKTPWVFTHLKLAIIDDVTFFGSHNLNMASSLANDELFVEVEDPVLATASRAMFDRTLRDNAEPVTAEGLALARPLGAWGRRLLDPVLGFW